MNKIVITLAAVLVSISIIHAVFFVPANNYQEWDSLVSRGDPSISQSDSRLEDLESVFLVKNPDDLRRRLEYLLESWVRDDPLLAVSAIEELTDHDWRVESYRVLLFVWDSHNRDSLMAWLARNRLAELDLALIALANRFSSEPELAVAFVDNIGDTFLRDKALGEVFQLWLGRDLEKALAWAALRDKGRNWLTIAYKALVIEDVQLALSAFSKQDGLSLCQIELIAQTIVASVNRNDVDDHFLSVISDVRPFIRREQLVKSLVQRLMGWDGVGFERLLQLVSSVSPSEVYDELHPLLVEQWTDSDPVEAADFALSLEGGARDAAVNAVVSSMVQEDLLAADRWLDEVKGNVDLAAQTLVHSAADQGSMQIANRWLDKIEDNDLRLQTIYAVMAQRFQYDPKAGIYYLVYQKALSEQQKLDRLHELYPDKIFSGRGML